PTIEQHVEWIADLLGFMRGQRYRVAEPEAAAEAAWGEHVGEVAGRTLRYTCASWYLGANIAGKPRVFMPYIGGFPKYVARCNEIAANRYQHFRLSAAPRQRNAATRAACSKITLALSRSGVPAGSPLIRTLGLDHTGRRGQPPQLAL